MSDQRTKARLAVSEFQSALRARFDADRDFTRAHDQLGKFIDDLVCARRRDSFESAKLTTGEFNEP